MSKIDAGLIEDIEATMESWAAELQELERQKELFEDFTRDKCFLNACLAEECAEFVEEKHKKTAEELVRLFSAAEPRWPHILLKALSDRS